MSQVLRCIECDKPIHAGTSDCPHCHTPYPFGVGCVGCCQVIKESEAIKHDSHNGLTIKYFHPSCFEQVMQTITKNVDFDENIIHKQTGKTVTVSRQNIDAMPYLMSLSQVGSAYHPLGKYGMKNPSVNLGFIVRGILLLIQFTLLVGILYYLLGDMGLILGVLLMVLFVLARFQ
ncbi:MAG: hypothetical protein ACRCT1_01630 [Microcoleaceae cyanobacterium]